MTPKPGLWLVGYRMRAALEWVKRLGVGRLVTACAALACLGAAPWRPFDSGDVLKIRFGGDQQQTRLVLELNRSTHGRVVVQGDGNRLILALPGLDVSGALDGDGQGLVRAWSLDRIAGSTAIQLSLTRPAQIARRFLLAPSEGSPNYRYVVDLVATGPVTPPSIMPGFGPTRSLAPARMEQVADVQSLHIRKVVVIDAGHGGKDPGALGGDSHEKDLTLAAAKALKKRLERDGRYTVVLTRTRDEFVPLETRVQIARHADADLFISLHADAGADPSTRGATVYTLSDKGADRAARNVMNRENWFLNVSLPGRDRAVNQILLDLTQRATKNQSSSFAEMLVDEVGGQTVMLQHSHRDAGYVVLLAPDLPAVLLEMGFITNPADESTLASAGSRTRLMGAVGDAIDEYFAQQRRYAAR